MLRTYCPQENIVAIVFGDSSAVQLDGLELLSGAGVELFHDPVLGKDLIVESNLRQPMRLRKVVVGRQRRTHTRVITLASQLVSYVSCLLIFLSQHQTHLISLCFLVLNLFCRL